MDYSSNDNQKKRKAYKSQSTKVKNKAALIVYRVFIAVILIGMFAGGGALVGAYLGVIENTPTLEPLKVMPSKYPSVIYYQDGTESERLRSEENREYVSFDKVPQNLKDAFVAIEDERFYDHNGVDLRGMVRAVYTNLTTKRKEGASTITQQLIKNNVRKIGKNTMTTKLQEQYMAIEYEKKLIEQFGSKRAAKDHILELYLNSINMHYSLNGVQTASDYYFNKDVSELTLSECAVIAAITQNPAKNAPIMNPERNRDRQVRILDKMLEHEMITESEYREAYDDDVYSRVSPKSKIAEVNNSVHSYFNDAVIKSVVDDLIEQYSIGRVEAFNWLYNGGFYIESTQDPKIQAIVDDVFVDNKNFSQKDFEIDIQYSATIKNSITDKTQNFYKSGTVNKEEDIPAKIEEFKNELLGANDTLVIDKYIPIPQPQANMVVTDFHNGQVKAMIGGRGEKMTNLALNRATDSKRQPGSVFKVLASFAPSIDLGVSTAATVYDDAPFEYNGWTVHNWYSGYKGLSTIRRGIEQSMNIVTVKNMLDTGIDNCFKYLNNFGFTTLVDGEIRNGKMHTDRTAATCLGGITDGVTQLELTSAYGTIANLGEYHKPIVYTKVIDHEGKLILENTPEPNQVLKKQSAYILTDMMKGVITNGTGGKAKFQKIKMPEAGKTGTTTDVKDLMYVGYTPYYVAGVWIGFDQPKPIKENNGYHISVWREVMERVHEDLPYKEFERPEGIISASICGASGKMAVSGLCSADPRGNMVKTDLFMAGTQSSDYCDIHATASVDVTTNMKASAYCPSDSVKRVVGILKTDETANNVDDKDYYINPEWINGPVCNYHGPNAINEPVPFPKNSESTSGEGAPLPDLGGLTPNTPGATQTPGDTQIDIPSIEQPKPAGTPVPAYTPKPAQTSPANETPPPGIPTPDLPGLTEPVSVDGFLY